MDICTVRDEHEKKGMTLKEVAIEQGVLDAADEEQYYTPQNAELDGPETRERPA